MKNKIVIVLISLVTCITTYFTWNFFIDLFFFLGFFNPALFVGTSPLLLSMLCAQREKRRYVLLGWLATSILLVIIASAIMFHTGWQVY